MYVITLLMFRHSLVERTIDSLHDFLDCLSAWNACDEIRTVFVPVYIVLCGCLDNSCGCLDSLTGCLDSLTGCLDNLARYLDY